MDAKRKTELTEFANLHLQGKADDIRGLAFDVLELLREVETLEKDIGALAKERDDWEQQVDDGLAEIGTLQTRVKELEARKDGEK